MGLAGDAAANQSTPTADTSYVKTSWFEIDDVFYEARGQTWALIHLLRAIEIDFASVLEKKNARVSLRQIIRERFLWSVKLLGKRSHGFNQRRR